MEKDDEVKGSGNSYDFGARMYDPRLGRWLTLDPLSKMYPNESPYIFAGNSPILFLDEEGKTKVTYLIAVHKDGTETKLAVIDAEEVAYKWVETADAAGGNYNTKGLYSYDIVQTIRYNAETGEVISDNTGYSMRGAAVSDWIGRNIGGALSKFEESLPGNGGQVKGGFYLVSKDGGESPTKYTAAEDVEKRDMTNFVGALKGIKGAKLGNFSPELLRKINSVAKEVLTPKSEQAESSKFTPGGSFICPTCSSPIGDTTEHNKGLDREAAPAPGYKQSE